MLTYSRQRGVLLITTVLIFINSFKLSHSHENPGGIKFDLVNKHDYLRLTQLERLRQSLHSDTIRLIEISRKVRLKQGNINHYNTNTMKRKIQEVKKTSTYFPACINNTRENDHNVSAELLMRSAADYGAGQYLVRFKVGSPAQKVMLIADTGSDLTWVNCRYRCRRGGHCRRDDRKRRVFRVDRSSSFKAVPCSTNTCRVDLANLFSLARCVDPMDPCGYDYRYSDGSATLGVFGNETITFSLTNGRKTRLHNVLVG